jgi:signal transduction histidine kinase
MNAARTTEKEQRRVLENIADICQDSMLEIRNYMDSLDGREINWPSWLADLRQYCFKTMEAHGINFEMHHVLNPKACRPSSLLTMNMFKIIREGLTNIIKHAGAGKVRLAIIIDGETLRLKLTDDGGANTGDIERNRHGRGILSMRARCHDLGGELSLRAENGLHIDIIIPLTAGSEHLVCRQENV